MTNEKIPTNQGLDELYLEKDGAIATLVINRPEKRNPISFRMWQALPSLVAEVEADDAVKVLVLRGAGDAAFSAGADISEFDRYRADSEGARLYNEATHDGERALVGLSKPSIAMVRGFCIGGGCELALACDFRFSDTTGRFGITPARLGIVYSLTATKQLVDLVGPATAKYILFSGQHVSAERALEVGLVDELLAPEELNARTREFAELLASRSQYSIRSMKQIIGRIVGGQVDDDAETTAMRDESFDTADYKEGVRAFLEKRPPRFG
ncbi:MAG: enoyl-CoA hydratase-related protein [Trueperaceae bacterium]